MGQDVFIKKFGNATNEFIETGDIFLNSTKGFCDSKIYNYKIDYWFISDFISKYGREQYQIYPFLFPISNSKP